MSLIAEIVAKVVAAFLAFWSGERQRRESNEAREELGAAKATAAGQRETAERVAAANRAEIAAANVHSRDATDAAFDGEFERHE